MPISCLLPASVTGWCSICMESTRWRKSLVWPRMRIVSPTRKDPDSSRIAATERWPNKWVPNPPALSPAKGPRGGGGGIAAGRGLGAWRAAAFFFGAAERAAGFLAGAFFGTTFLRVAGFLAGAFLRLTLAFFFAAAMVPSVRYAGRTILIVWTEHINARAGNQSSRWAMEFA